MGVKPTGRLSKTPLKPSAAAAPRTGSRLKAGPATTPSVGVGASSSPRPPPPKAALDSARARLEADSVEILSRQKQELAVECDRLRAKANEKAESFKIAWQEERAAHQRDLASAATAASNAEAEARRLSEELHAARETLSRQSSSAEAELAQLRQMVETGRARFEQMAHDGQEQLRSLQRQLARARAEKGALCEEFSSKLAQIAGGGGGVTGTNAMAAGAPIGGSATFPALPPGYESLSFIVSGAGGAAGQLPGCNGGASEAGGDDVGVASSGVTSRGITAGGGVAGGGGTEAGEPGGSQRRAIGEMKLAQQLRTAEAELEKATRLLASKSRRVTELEAELEAGRMQVIAKEAETAGAQAERAAAEERRDREAARATRLQGEADRVREALRRREDELSELKQEQLRLVAHLDTMQLTGGGGAPRGGTASKGSQLFGSAAATLDSTWRPPLHPPGLMRAARHSPVATLPQGASATASGALSRKASTTRARGQLTAAAAACGAVEADGTLTARSEASTISEGEWPDELQL